MKIRKIRDIARGQEREPGKAEKVQLIRAIQRQEGARLFCHGPGGRIRSRRLPVAHRLFRRGQEQKVFLNRRLF